VSRVLLRVLSDTAGIPLDSGGALKLLVLAPTPEFTGRKSRKGPDGGRVWSSPPVMDEASGPIVYLCLTYGRAEEVSEYAASLARGHGLVCYDPQGECLRP
jgi:hypothetical protein